MGETTEASLPYNRVIFIETTVSPRFLDLNGYEVISSQIGNKPDDFDCTQRHDPLESISCYTINTTKDGQEKVFFYIFNIRDNSS